MRGKAHSLGRRRGAPVWFATLASGKHGGVPRTAIRDLDAAGPWRTEATDLLRAASGGLLFGVPLLYTMEVWWVGSHTTAVQMLTVLGALALVLLVLNTTAGFRAAPDVRIADAVADTVPALAIGLVVTGIVLLLIQEITVTTPAEQALGKMVYEAVPFCLGVGVARHFLRGRRAGPDEDEDGGGADQDDPDRVGALADLGAAAIGATFIALSIAPTDEVPMIASALGPGWVLALVGASLVSSYVIVFEADLVGQADRRSQQGAFQLPVTETIVAYLVALAVAACLLWIFQRDAEPTMDFARRVVVLGFPAAIGGAAGRLAL
jgi:putative integral membrane protein (TIGR02587 family)